MDQSRPEPDSGNQIAFERETFRDTKFFIFHSSPSSSESALSCQEFR
jgi:hypothetical protein